MSTEKDMKDRDKLSLDSILIEEVGQFGRYQWINLALAAAAVVFTAFNNNEYVFTTARITSRCHIPECEGINPEFTSPWTEHAIPRLPSGAFDQCSRFISNSNFSQLMNGTCHATMFASSVTEPCDQYVYENKNTIVYDFDLGCAEWKRSWAGSIKLMGSFVGMFLTGLISDRWGRRVALVFNVVNSTWLGLVRSFINSYEWFIALEFIETSLGTGIYTCCYILVSELVGPKYRVLAGAILSSTFSLAQAAFGLITWAVPHWRTLLQVVYTPQLIFISYLWLMSESIRWLLSKGRFEEAEENLQKVAAKNKKTLSDKSLKALRASAQPQMDVKKAKEPWLPILVFRSRIMLTRCCITPFWWITNTLVYFGLNINSLNLAGNSNFNYSYVALIDIPGRWAAFLLLDRLGRKPVIFITYSLCCVCQFMFAFLPEGMESLKMAVYLIGKSCIAGMTLAIYVYTTELYPTKYRHQLFAFSSMVGRTGSVIAPLTPALALEVWGPLPSVLFGSCALLSAMLVFLMPETLGTNLPETMEDAEDISKNKIIA